MRRLGQELGRDPMGLYCYAANRAALLDGVSELVLDELSIIPEDSAWQAQLRLPPKDFPRLRTLAPVLLTTTAKPNWTKASASSSPA